MLDQDFYKSPRDQGRMDETSFVRQESTLEPCLINPDGSQVGRELPQSEINSNLSAMYLREKPLLDKIRNMRLDYEQLMARCSALESDNQRLAAENAQVQELRAQNRLLIQRLESEDPMSTARSSQKPPKKSTSRSQLHTDRSRSRSINAPRDCCVKRDRAVKKELTQQQQRISTKQRTSRSPLNQTRNISAEKSRTPTRIDQKQKLLYQTLSAIDLSSVLKQGSSSYESESVAKFM